VSTKIFVVLNQAIQAIVIFSIWGGGLVVAPDLRRIFRYRHERLMDVFGREGARPDPITIDDVR
jgi:hypothetical protein